MNTKFFLLLSASFSFFVGCRQNPEVVNEAYAFQNNILTVKKGNGEYEISALSDHLIKVTYSDSATVGNLVHAPVLTEPVDVEFRDSEEKLILSTAKTRVEVTKDPVRIEFYDEKAGLKLSEETGYFRDGDTSTYRFGLNDTEKIYGFGFKAIPLNRRGHRFDHYNQPAYGYGLGAANLNYSVPVLVSSKKYMLLFDNPARGYFDVGKSENDILEFGNLGNNQAYYFVNGDNFESLMSEYVHLTGRQELPPIWALGNLQSRFGYRTQAQAERVLNKTIEAGYPVDVIIIDLYWFSKEIQDGRLGNLQWDNEAWPDPEGMIRDFASKGVKTVLVSEPFFCNTCINYDEMVEKKLLATDEAGNPLIISDFYFCQGGLIDIFKQEAKDWFWNQYKEEMEIGVAGWWGDLGEPEKHPDTMVHVNGIAREVHGIYGHHWIKSMYEGYEKDYPDRRFFKLARAGFAGTQRYGIIPWTGDVGRSWSGYEAQLPSLLSSSIVGLGYMHADAGGFSRAERDSVLYMRWMQFATFTPIFRPHGDETVPTEVVLFSQEVQDVLRPYFELRYRLMPYMYTMAWQNSMTGIPLMRPLFMAFEDDPNLAETQNEYMFGPDLFVAPVMTPDATERTFYLPKGEWYDWWSAQKHTGGKEISIATPIEVMPVLAKAGSIIPTVPVFQTTDQYSTEKLLITYYTPSGDMASSADIYDDDGQTKITQTDTNYDLISIDASKAGKTVEFLIEKSGNSFAGAPAKRLMDFTLIGGQTASSVTLNSEELDFKWNGKSQRLTFQVPFENEAQIVVTF
ncbi:MAG: TIM-barrel domain-containing protein [Bacteroidota bacterium]